MAGMFPEPCALGLPRCDLPTDEEIRVLVTAPVLTKPGGVAVYFRTLRSLMRDEVHYFAVGSRSDDEHPAMAILRLVRDSIRFTVALVMNRYDLVHLNPSIGSKALLRDGVLLIIAKALRKKVVVFVHGWDVRCERLLRSCCAAPFRLVFGRADAFIVLGETFRASLKTLGYKGPVFVVIAPVDESIFEATGQAHTEVAGAPRLLFLSRVEREKGIFEALSVYRLVKTKYPHTSLVVAGEGSALQEAKARVAEQEIGDVWFLGHVDADSRLDALRSTTIYLFPSHGEGLPLSVLEAMAFGLPIVTTSVGSLRDFFRDGQMGFSSQDPDPERLADFVCRLIANPSLRLRIGAFNRAYASNHFRASQLAARIEQIYRFVLGSADGSLLESSGPAHL